MLEQAALPVILVAALAADLSARIARPNSTWASALARGLDSFSANAASFIASPTHLHRAILARFTDADLMGEANAVLFPGYLPLSSAWWARGVPRPIHSRLAIIGSRALLRLERRCWSSRRCSSQSWRPPMKDSASGSEQMLSPRCASPGASGWSCRSFSH